MRKLITLLSLLAMSGCAAMDRQRCQNYGFEQGTDAFANCMQTVDIQRGIALQNLANSLRTTHCYTSWGYTTCNTW